MVENKKEKYCPQCGEVVVSKFCAKCGNDLSSIIDSDVNNEVVDPIYTFDEDGVVVSDGILNEEVTANEGFVAGIEDNIDIPNSDVIVPIEETTIPNNNIEPLPIVKESSEITGNVSIYPVNEDAECMADLLTKSCVRYITTAKLVRENRNLKVISGKVLDGAEPLVSPISIDRSRIEEVVVPKEEEEKKSKKFLIIILIFIALLLLLLFFTVFNKKDEKMYTVSFKVNGGSEINEVQVKSKNPVEEPNAPIREGYSFVGWYYNGKPYDFDTEITGDITLEARWEEIHVSNVSINPAEITIKVGDSEKLEAVIEPYDSLNQNVTWESSNPDIVSIDEDGNITANKKGTVTITVTSEDGSITGECTVKVAELIIPVSGVSLDKKDDTILVGASTTLVATVGPENASNKAVTWKSDNEKVATVNNNGVVTGKSEGTAKITVTTRDGNFKATATIKVSDVHVKSVTLNESSMNIRVGDSYQFIATVNPKDAANKKVGWTIQNTDIATVDANGKVTGKSVGTTTLIVKTADGGKTAKATINVAAISAESVSLDRRTMDLTKNDSPKKLTATVMPANTTNKKVTWSSSKESVATVDQNGNVTPVGSGTTTIKVTTEDGGFTATCTVTVTNPVTSVSVSPQSKTIYVGDTLDITATVTPSDADDKSISWSSSKTAVATVNNSGKVTAVSAGDVDITAKSVNNKTATAKITVKDKVIITINKNENTYWRNHEIKRATKNGANLNLAQSGVSIKYGNDTYNSSNWFGTYYSPTISSSAYNTSIKTGKLTIDGKTYDVEFKYE